MIEKNHNSTSRVARISLIINLMLLVGKLAAGIWSRSAALIADAVHSASDAGATVAVMIGLKVARKPADKNHPYGHAKAEAVAAKVVAIILVFTGFGLGWEAFQILQEGRAETPGTTALWVAAGAIVIKVFLYRFVKAKAEQAKSSALDADAENHRSDILATSAALLGIAAARLGFPVADPLAGMVVAGLILKMAFEIYKKSILELMDTAPEEEVTKHIALAAQNTPGVIAVNETKARIHGSGVLVDMRLCVDGRISVFEGHDIAKQVAENIHRAEQEVLNVLVHVNPCTVNQQRLDQAWCHKCGAKASGKMILG